MTLRSSKYSAPPKPVRKREWGRVELRAGADYRAASSTAAEPAWGLRVGAGYFVLPERLSLDLRGTVASGADGFGAAYQIRAGVRAHVRVPLTFLFAGAAMGYGSSDGGDGIVIEAEAGLRLAASRWVAPELTVAYQLTQGEEWGHQLRVGAGLAVSF